MCDFNINSIKLNSGKIATKDQVLQNELLVNINNDEARVELLQSTLQSMMKDIDNRGADKDNEDDIRILPAYIYKEDRSNTNLDGINKFTKYSKIDMLLILLDINDENKFALSTICYLMIRLNIKQVKIPSSSGTILKLEDLAIKNYLVNRMVSDDGIVNSKDSKYDSDYRDKSYYYLVDALSPKRTFNLKDGTVVKLEEELTKALERSPNNSLLYYYLSTLLKDNSTTVTLNDSINGKRTLNRIELLILATKNEKDDFYLSTYYYFIANFMSNNETVSLDGQEYSRVQLLITSVEIRSSPLVVKLLVELLKPFQRVEVNKKIYSRADLVNSFIVNDHPEIAYYLLSTIYKQQNNIKKSNYYAKLYLKYRRQINNNKAINK